MAGGVTINSRVVAGGAVNISGVERPVVQNTVRVVPLVTSVVTHTGPQGPVGPQGPAGSGGGSAAWGGITGTLSSQTDLQTALDAKQATITNSDGITQGSSNLFLTTAERTKLTNTSGTNTGDQTSVSGNAGTVTNGVYTTDTATVTNTMLAGSIASSKLANGAVANLSGTNTGDQTLPVGGTPALTLGTANAAGVSPNFLRRDDTILAFDATVPSTQAFGDAASAGVATVAARRDHKHAMPAAPTTITGNAGTATKLATARTIGTLTGDVTSAGSTFDGSAVNTNATVVARINGVSMAGLATGILKNTTTTGVPSIAVAADFPTLNQNTTGSAAKLTTARNIAGVAFDGTAAISLTSGSGIQKGDGAGGFTAATANTDYLPVATPAMTGAATADSILWNNNAVTVAANAATVPITKRLTTVTNNAAGAVTITITTTSATDGQLLIVRFYDFSAVAQTITWVNTENSLVSVPGTSNGSTTLPTTAGFQFNGQTSKWRCIAVA